jgi:hypothetical protein
LILAKFFSLFAKPNRKKQKAWPVIQISITNTYGCIKKTEERNKNSALAWVVWPVMNYDNAQLQPRMTAVQSIEIGMIRAMCKRN